MTGDQQFLVALFVQLVILMGMWLNHRQSVRNHKVAHRAVEKVEQLTGQVDGKLTQLLEAKDRVAALAVELAREEGIQIGRATSRRRSDDPGHDPTYQVPNV